jgi:hypothetical protein
VLRVAVLDWLLSAAFPRLTRRLHWPVGLKPRGLLLYVVADTAFTFGLREWLRSRRGSADETPTGPPNAD